MVQNRRNETEFNVWMEWGYEMGDSGVVLLKKRPGTLKVEFSYYPLLTLFFNFTAQITVHKYVFIYLIFISPAKL